MTLSLRNAYRRYRKNAASVYILTYPTNAGYSDVTEIANAMIDMRRSGCGGIVTMSSDYSYEPMRDSWLDRFWTAKLARS